MVGSVPSSSLGPEEEGVGEKPRRGEGKGEDATVGQITRTISFRVSSEHYPDNDGHDVERQRTDTIGAGRRHEQQQEWPLNPLSPVDGVSPWYEDEESPRRSPHEDYLRMREWHNRDF